MASKSTAKSAPKKAAGAARAWLFTGPEIGEKAAEIERLRKQAEKQCGAPLEDYKYYAADIKTGELVSLLQNGSLFSAGKFVVLRNAELIKLKDEVATLADWIASSGAEDAESPSFLVMTSDEISVDKKLEAALPSANKRIFWELFEDRKEQWLVSFFRKEGLDIDEKAVRLILEMVENNTEALRAACSPFPLFYERGARITEAEVDTILSHNREESAFTLFDALAKHDFEGAVSIFRKISLSKESAPPQIIAGLSYCFRRLLDWHALAAQYGGDGGGQSGYGGYRGGGIPGDAMKRAGFTSSKAQNQYRAAARLWDSGNTERILAMLTDADGDFRSSGAQIHGVLFERLLFRIYSLSRNAGRGAGFAGARRGTAFSNATPRRF